MTEEHRSDGRSIDEILAEARPSWTKRRTSRSRPPNQGTPEPDDFTPDFGHTFDDYGEFEEPQPEEDSRRSRPQSATSALCRCL